MKTLLAGAQILKLEKIVQMSGAITQAGDGDYTSQPAVAAPLILGAIHPDRKLELKRPPGSTSGIEIL